MGSNIRQYMSTMKWPSEYHQMVASYVRTYVRTGSGTLETDIASLFPSSTDSKPRPVDPDARAELYDEEKEEVLADGVYSHLLALINCTSERQFLAFHYSVNTGRTDGALVLSKCAQYVPMEKHRGVFYSSSQKSEKNSFVLFKHAGSSTPIPGQIQRIFRHCRAETDGQAIVQTFLLVKSYAPLQPAHIAMDPFRQYPLLRCFLCYNELNPVSSLIRLGDVVSHFAAMVYTPSEIQKECIVVRSLNRVRMFCMRRALSQD